MANVEYPVRNDNHPRIWLSKQNMPRGLANSENRAVSLFGFNYCHVILGAKSALCLSAMMLHVVKPMVRDVYVSGTFSAILCFFNIRICCLFWMTPSAQNLFAETPQKVLGWYDKESNLHCLLPNFFETNVA